MFAFLGRHWFMVALVLGLGAALTWPGVLRYVTDWDPRYAVAVTLFLTAWTMPTHSLLAEARQPFASLWAVILSYGLVPVLAWAMGYFAEENVQAGLILIATVPCTLSAAVLWTRLAGGCHPNRETERAVEAGGFRIDAESRRAKGTMRRFVAWPII